MSSEANELLTYANPRTYVAIEDWPLGGTRRGAALFEVESTSRGERAVRTTTGKPKKLTYAAKVRFVDGSDGRLYVIHKPQEYNMITVMKGTFDFSHETIHKRDTPGRYEEILKLFDDVTAVLECPCCELKAYRKACSPAELTTGQCMDCGTQMAIVS